MKPLERHKLFITREANDIRPPKSVGAVSVDHSSDISTLVGAISGLQNSVDALIGVSMAHNHRIAKLKQCQKEADIFESDDNTSDNKDVTLPSHSILALARVELAVGSKKRKKGK